MLIPRTALAGFQRVVGRGGYLQVLDLPGDHNDEALVIYANNEEHRNAIRTICAIVVLSNRRLFNSFINASPGAQKAIAGSAFALSAGIGALTLWIILMYYGSNGSFRTTFALDCQLTCIHWQSASRHPLKLYAVLFADSSERCLLGCWRASRIFPVR